MKSHIAESGIASQGGSSAIGLVIVCFFILVLVILPLVFGLIEYEHYTHNKKNIIDATDIVANDLFAMLNAGELSQKQIRSNGSINTTATTVLKALLGDQIEIRNMTISLDHTALTIHYEIKYNSVTFLNNKWLVIDCLYEVGINQ